MLINIPARVIYFFRALRAFAFSEQVSERCRENLRVRIYPYLGVNVNAMNFKYRADDFLVPAMQSSTNSAELLKEPSWHTRTLE